MIEGFRLKIAVQFQCTPTAYNVIDIQLMSSHKKINNRKVCENKNFETNSMIDLSISSRITMLIGDLYASSKTYSHFSVN